MLWYKEEPELKNSVVHRWLLNLATTANRITNCLGGQYGLTDFKRENLYTAAMLFIQSVQQYGK